MNPTELFNNKYCDLNHFHIQFANFLKDLMETEEIKTDTELQKLANLCTISLQCSNEALDYIKSKMTVKTKAVQEKKPASSKGNVFYTDASMFQ